MRSFFLILGSVVLATVAHGQGLQLEPVQTSGISPAAIPRGPAKGNAVPILNAFIATFAKDNPGWKTEIVLLEDPRSVPPGKQLGYSKKLKAYYSFRPKFWEELLPEEKANVLHDSRLKSFLVSERNKMIFPSISNADAEIPTTKRVFPVEGGTVEESPPQVPAGAAVVDAPGQKIRIKITAAEMLTERPLRVSVQ